MKKVCEIAGLSEDEFFSYLIKTLKVKIPKWDMATPNKALQWSCNPPAPVACH